RIGHPRDEHGRPHDRVVLPMERGQRSGTGAGRGGRGGRGERGERDDGKDQAHARVLAPPDEKPMSATTPASAPDRAATPRPSSPTAPASRHAATATRPPT